MYLAQKMASVLQRNSKDVLADKIFLEQAYPLIKQYQGGGLHDATSQIDIELMINVTSKAVSVLVQTLGLWSNSRLEEMIVQVYDMVRLLAAMHQQADFVMSRDFCKVLEPSLAQIMAAEESALPAVIEKFQAELENLAVMQTAVAGKLKAAVADLKSLYEYIYILYIYIFMYV